MGTFNGGSVAAMLSAEPVLKALRNGGLTDEVMQAIINYPEIAETVVQAAQNAVEALRMQDGAELRREVLAMYILESNHKFTQRELNILSRANIVTVEQLVFTSEAELRFHEGVGDRFIMAVHRFLADHGLTLVADNATREQLLHTAIGLYGGFGYIPEHMLTALTVGS